MEKLSVFETKNKAQNISSLFSFPSTYRTTDDKIEIDEVTRIFTSDSEPIDYLSIDFLKNFILSTANKWLEGKF